MTNFGRRKMMGKVLAWVLAVIMMVPSTGINAYAANVAPDSENGIVVADAVNDPEAPVMTEGDQDETETPVGEEPAADPDEEDSESDEEDADADASKEKEETEEADAEKKEETLSETETELPEGAVSVTGEGAFLDGNGVPLPNPDLLGGDDIETYAVEVYLVDPVDSSKEILLDRFDRWVTKAGDGTGAVSFISSIGNAELSYIVKFNDDLGTGETFSLPTSVDWVTFKNESSGSIDLLASNSVNVALSLTSNVEFVDFYGFDEGEVVYGIDVKSVALNGYYLWVNSSAMKVGGTITGKKGPNESIYVSAESNYANMKICGAVSNIGGITVAGNAYESSGKDAKLTMCSTVKNIDKIFVYYGCVEANCDGTKADAPSVQVKELVLADLSKFISNNGASISTLTTSINFPLKEGIVPNEQNAIKDSLSGVVVQNGDLKIGRVDTENCSYAGYLIAQSGKITISDVNKSTRNPLLLAPIYPKDDGYAGYSFLGEGESRDSDKKYIDDLTVANGLPIATAPNALTSGYRVVSLNIDSAGAMTPATTEEGGVKTQGVVLENSKLYVGSESSKFALYESEWGTNTYNSNGYKGSYDSLQKALNQITALNDKTARYWIVADSSGVDDPSTNVVLSKLPSQAEKITIAGVNPVSGVSADTDSDGVILNLNMSGLKAWTLPTNIILKDVALNGMESVAINTGAFDLTLDHVSASDTGDPLTVASIAGNGKNTLTVTGNLNVTGDLKNFADVTLTGDAEESAVTVLGNVATVTNLHLGTFNVGDEVKAVALKVAKNFGVTNIYNSKGGNVVYTTVTTNPKTIENDSDSFTVSNPLLTIMGNVYLESAVNPLQIAIARSCVDTEGKDAFDKLFSAIRFCDNTGSPYEFVTTSNGGAGVQLAKCANVSADQITLAPDCFYGLTTEEFPFQISKDSKNYVVCIEDGEGNVELSYQDASGQTVKTTFATWNQAIAEITALKTKRDYTITLYADIVNANDVNSSDPSLLKLPAATVAASLSIVGKNERVEGASVNIDFTDTAITFNTDTYLENVILTPYTKVGTEFIPVIDKVAAPSITKITCKGVLTIGNNVAVENQVSFLGGNTGKLIFEEVEKPFGSAGYSYNGSTLSKVDVADGQLYGSIEGFAEVVIPYENFLVGYAITSAKGNIAGGSIAATTLNKTAEDGTMTVENFVKVTNLYDESDANSGTGVYAMTVGDIEDLDRLNLDTSKSTTVIPTGYLTATNVYLYNGAEYTVNGAVTITGDTYLTGDSTFPAKISAATMAIKNLTMEQGCLYALQTMNITGLVNSIGTENELHTHRAIAKNGAVQLPYLTVAGNVILQDPADAIKVTVYEPVCEKEVEGANGEAAVTAGKKNNNQSWIQDWAYVTGEVTFVSSVKTPVNAGALLTAKVAGAECFIASDDHQGETANGLVSFKNKTVIYVYDLDDVVVKVKKDDALFGYYPTWADAVAAINAEKADAEGHSYEMNVLHNIGCSDDADAVVDTPIAFTIPTVGSYISIVTDSEAGSRKTIAFTGNLSIATNTRITNLTLKPVKKVGTTYNPVNFDIALNKAILGLGVEAGLLNSESGKELVIDTGSSTDVCIGNITSTRPGANDTTKGSLYWGNISTTSVAPKILGAVTIYGSLISEGVVVSGPTFYMAGNKANTISVVSLNEASMISNGTLTIETLKMNTGAQLSAYGVTTIGNIESIGGGNGISTNRQCYEDTNRSKEKCTLSINGTVTLDDPANKLWIKVSGSGRDHFNIDSAVSGGSTSSFVKYNESYKLANIKLANPNQFVLTLNGNYVDTLLKYKGGLYYSGSGMGVDLGICDPNHMDTPTSTVRVLDFEQAVNEINTINNKNNGYLISVDGDIADANLTDANAVSALSMPGKDKYDTFKIDGDYEDDGSHPTITASSVGTMYGTVVLHEFELVGKSVKGDKDAELKLTLKKNSDNKSSLDMVEITSPASVDDTKSDYYVAQNGTKALTGGLGIGSITGEKGVSELYIENKSINSDTIIGGDISNMKEIVTIQDNGGRLWILGSVKTGIDTLGIYGDTFIKGDLTLTGTLWLNDSNDTTNKLYLGGTANLVSVAKEDGQSGAYSYVITTPIKYASGKTTPTMTITGHVSIWNNGPITIAGYYANDVKEKGIVAGDVMTATASMPVAFAKAPIRGADRFAYANIAADITVPIYYKDTNGYVTVGDKANMAAKVQRLTADGNPVNEVTYATSYADAVKIIDMMAPVADSDYCITLLKDLNYTGAKDGTVSAITFPTKMGNGKTLKIVGDQNAIRFDGTITPTCNLIFEDVTLDGRKGTAPALKLNLTKDYHVSFEGDTCSEWVVKSGDLPKTVAIEKREEKGQLVFDSITGTKGTVSFDMTAAVGGNTPIVPEDDETVIIGGEEAVPTAGKIHLLGTSSINSLQLQSGAHVTLEEGIKVTITNLVCESNYDGYVIDGREIDYTDKKITSLSIGAVELHKNTKLANPTTVGDVTNVENDYTLTILKPRGKSVVKNVTLYPSNLTVAGDVSDGVKVILDLPVIEGENVSYLTREELNCTDSETITANAFKMIATVKKSSLSVFEIKTGDSEFTKAIDRNFFKIGEGLYLTDQTPALTVWQGGKDEIFGHFFAMEQAIATIDAANNMSYYTICVEKDLGSAESPINSFPTAKNAAGVMIYAQNDSHIYFKGNITLNSGLYLKDITLEGYSAPNKQNAFNISVGAFYLTFYNASATNVGKITGKKNSGSEISLLCCSDLNAKGIDGFDRFEMDDEIGYSDIDNEGVAFGTTTNIGEIKAKQCSYVSLGAATNIGNIFITDDSSCEYETVLTATTLTVNEAIGFPSHGDVNELPAVLSNTDIKCKDAFGYGLLQALSITSTGTTSMDGMQIYALGSPKSNTGVIKLNEVRTYDGSYDPSSGRENVIISQQDKKGNSQITISGEVSTGNPAGTNKIAIAHAINIDHALVDGSIRLVPIKSGVKMLTAPKAGSSDFYRYLEHWDAGEDEYVSNYNAGDTTPYKSGKDIYCGNTGTQVEMKVYKSATQYASDKPASQSKYLTLADALADITTRGDADLATTTYSILLHDNNCDVVNAKGAYQALNLPARKNAQVEISSTVAETSVTYLSNLTLKSNLRLNKLNLVPVNAKGVPTAANLVAGNFDLVLENCSDEKDGKTALIGNLTGNAKLGSITVKGGDLTVGSATNIANLILCGDQSATTETSDQNILKVNGNVSVTKLTLGNAATYTDPVSPTKTWQAKYGINELRAGGNVIVTGIELKEDGCIQIDPGKLITVNQTITGVAGKKLMVRLNADRITKNTKVMKYIGTVNNIVAADTSVDTEQGDYKLYRDGSMFYVTNRDYGSLPR